MKSKLTRKALSLVLTICLVATSLGALSIPAAAASEDLTGIGLAEFGLKAYREGWEYEYGGYGQLNGHGVRESDCSGLIFAYLCWDGDDSDPLPDYNMPRTVTAQVDAAIESGSTADLPRTHGLLLTIYDYDHVGIYAGDDMVVENSSEGVDMKYTSVSSTSKWLEWHKLDCIEYPTNGWYRFDGDPFFYENGEYVIDTTKTIDGVSYHFDSHGAPSPTPPDFSDGAGGSDDSVTYPDSIPATTTTGVNFRRAPDLDSHIIRTLGEGTEVTIVDNSDPEWAKVRIFGRSIGYVCKRYLSYSGSPSEPEPPTNPENIQAVTTATVNLRKSATTDSDILALVDEGTKLTITEKTNSSWYRVKLSGGNTGYIYASYLEEVNSSDDSSDDSENIPAHTTTDVFLRKGASTDYDYIDLLSEGTNLTILNKSNSSWYKVKLSDGTKGYVYSQYLKTDSSPSTPPEGDTPDSESTDGTTTAYVNLREGAGTNYSVIDTIDTGTALTITNRSNSAWYKVTLSDGRSGYMSSAYIQEGSSAKTLKTTAYVNLRNAPGLSSEILTVVAEGTRVTILDTDNSDWYKIKLASGKTGYMSSDYLE